MTQRLCLVIPATIVCLIGCRDVNEYVPPPPPRVTAAKPLVQEIVSFVEVPGRAAAVEIGDLDGREVARARDSCYVCVAVGINSDAR